MAKCENESVRIFGSDEVFKGYLGHFLGDLDVFCAQVYRKVPQKTKKQHPRTCEPILKKISMDFAPPGVNEKQVWHSCPLVSGRE